MLNEVLNDQEKKVRTKMNCSQINNIDYGEKIWEFRWIGDEDEDKVINGPYSSYEMNHWKETYFENKVEVRKIGETKKILNILMNLHKRLLLLLLIIHHEILK